MIDEQEIRFGPFHLDPVTGQLMSGERVVALQPKPLAVLHYLAQRPGQVVTKQELLKAVWAGTVVTKAVVKEACAWCALRWEKMRRLRTTSRPWGGRDTASSA